MKQPHTIIRSVALVCALLSLAGCQNPTHLVYHQNTVLGLDVATSAEGGTIHATLAYDRQTTAFVPKTQVAIPDGQGGVKKLEFEAMSVISKSEMHLKFLSTQQVHEIFATGEAAINLARRPEALKALGESSGK